MVAAVSLGCGLLTDRIAGRSIPRPLLLPVGFAGVVVVATLMTIGDTTAELAPAAIAVAALAGYGLTAVDKGLSLRPARAWLAPSLAMLLPLLAIAAPVVLTGSPGFTGYTRIVDLGFQLDVAAHLLEEGRSLEDIEADSSHHEVVTRILGSAYPAGAQATLGATAQLARIDPIWAWQPFMAWMAGMLGLALYGLLARAISSRLARGVAAGVAAQPTILYSYALASGIKELAAATFVALLAALLAGLLAPGRGGAGARGAIAPALALAAGLCAVNVGILPWAVVLVAAAVVARFGARVGARVARGGRTISLRGALIALGAAALVVVPATQVAIRLQPILATGGPQDLGNLAAPVPAWAALGPWLTSDYRYPLDVPGTETTTAILAAVAALLALLGLVRGARRDRGLAAAGVAAVAAVAMVVWKGGEWVQLKAITISAPLLVAVAFAGAAAIAGSRLRSAAALLAGAIVAASILAGNALVYRTTPLAPYERLAELQDLAERFDGQGPMLHPSFDEYAGYLLRDARLVGTAVAPDGPVEGGLLTPGAVEPEFSKDLDQMAPSFIAQFDLILLRRGDPARSEPPSNWRLVHGTRYYDVYRREPSLPAVIAHLPQNGDRGERPPSFCRRLETHAARAGAPARIAYATSVASELAEPAAAAVPPGWLVAGPVRLARGPGRLRYEAQIVAGGDYDLAVRGSFGRRVEILVDGRPAAALRWRANYPSHYEPLGTFRLDAGLHRLELVRGGGSLLPGTGNDIAGEGTITRIGPISLVRSQRPVVRTVSLREGLEVCRSQRRLDWIEVVRPRPGATHPG